MIQASRAALSAAVITLACVGASHATTIAASDAAPALDGRSLDLSGHAICGTAGALVTNVGRFTAGGAAGSGHSVCGTAGSVQVKDDGTATFGRHDPAGTGRWIDSNDSPHVRWEVDIGSRFTDLSFALTDANDQPGSYFEIVANGARWSLEAQEPDAGLKWITISFGQAVDGATIEFFTARNDGFGISAVTVAPIPVPPAALMMASGLALIAAARYRRARRPA